MAREISSGLEVGEFFRFFSILWACLSSYSGKFREGGFLLDFLLLFRPNCVLLLVIVAALDMSWYVDLIKTDSDSLEVGWFQRLRSSTKFGARISS